ncbi:zinc-dependent metalloprotease [Arcanobacterium phocisimile]|uniref:Zinc-dependent metalloprotease n=1 Tax=Arcanobacterium phocisimile TaxID=1302235 RepID=A0ABX7IIZ6_9ACTO|nr:zinc-dependent metalloprotease [Arcanobacterium phocisimile]QRV02414.1 zinc-dependent metalloprotease [Arcanobacterium phocisimile]
MADNARKLTQLFTGSGPSMSPVQVQSLISDLKEASWQARTIVAEVARMSVPAVPVQVVDRSRWITAMVESVQKMLGRSEPPVTLSAFQIRAVGLVVSRRVLGQWDPYGQKPQMYLVAPNIAQFMDDYLLNQKDLALWVVIHELTHAAQFYTAPWLADYIAQLATGVVNTKSDDEEAYIDHITAVMSLLEGHATYVSDQASTNVLFSQAQLAQAIASRRAHGGVVAHKVKQLLGLTEKAQQYSQGRDFVADVVTAVGVDTFNKVWDDERNLPTLTELHDPQLWMARIEGATVKPEGGNI